MKIQDYMNKTIGSAPILYGDYRVKVDDVDATDRYSIRLIGSARRSALCLDFDRLRKEWDSNQLSLFVRPIVICDPIHAVGDYIDFVWETYVPGNHVLHIESPRGTATSIRRIRGTVDMSRTLVQPFGAKVISGDEGAVFRVSWIGVENEISDEERASVRKATTDNSRWHHLQTPVLAKRVKDYSLKVAGADAEL